MMSAVFEVVSVRALAIAAAVGLALMLPAPQLFAAMIVLGHGHFMLGYWYQAEGGHLPTRKLVLLGAALALLVFAGLSLPLIVFGFLAGMGFLLHFTYDEIRLVNGKPTLLSVLEAAPFVVLYASLYADAIFSLGSLPYAALLIIGLVVLYAALMRLYSHRPGWNALVFLAWALLTAVAYSIAAAYSPASTVTWLWGIVLIHYGVWYGFYWFKLKPAPKKRRRYVTRVLALNALLIALALVWHWTEIPLLALLFTPLAFFVWTFLHGIASLKFGTARV